MKIKQKIETGELPATLIPGGHQYDAHALTIALRGKWWGRYGLAFCPAHRNTRTPALSLKQGIGGRLLAHCHAGCEFRSIMSALRGLGLMEGGSGYVAPDPAQQAKRTAEEKSKAEKRARQAKALWDEAIPIEGTVAETYLRARGIDCPIPHTLRFAPSCWHATAKRFPALVAQVEGCDRFAVHRTYLAQDGNGKASVEPAKAMLGGVAGGAVRLSAGPGRLVVAEGIETALSLLCGLLAGPVTVWAALSTSGIQGLRLPALPGHLAIAPDGDKAGRAAAQILAERATREGWSVSILTPPDCADFNDLLRGGETK